jgi:hypothetical protein
LITQSAAQDILKGPKRINLLPKLNVNVIFDEGADEDLYGIPNFIGAMTDGLHMKIASSDEYHPAIVQVLKIFIVAARKRFVTTTIGPEREAHNIPVRPENQHTFEPRDRSAHSPQLSCTFPAPYRRAALRDIALRAPFTQVH